MSCTDIANYNFKVTKGDDDTISFRYLSEGSPVDLSGSSIYFECDVDAINQLCGMQDPMTGEFTLDIVGSTTLSLDKVNIKYYIRRWPSGLNGRRNTIFSGVMTLEG